MTAALLLDLDGTLVDSEPLHRASYVAYFAERGWSDVDLRIFTGRRASDVFAVEPGPWAGEDPVALARAVMAQIDADARPTPVPGAAELVRLAAAQVPVAVVTSAGPRWVDLAVGEVLGVLDLVSTVVTGLDVERGKPDPAGFALACTRLGVDARDAVAFEDSPAGVQAARGAGVGRVVGVTTTWGADALRSAGADDAVPDLVDRWRPQGSVEA